MLISELIQRSPPLITEAESLRSLRKGMPDHKADSRQWEAYLDRLLNIPDPFEICVAEGIDRIAVSEGNHRLYIIWHEMIGPGYIQDFDIKVVVRKVEATELGRYTVERAMGKPQALHFRMLLDLNFVFYLFLENLGYNLSGYDQEDFTMLEGIIKRIKREETQNGRRSIRSEDDQIKVFGPFRDLAWRPHAEIFGDKKDSSALEDRIELIIETQDPDPSLLLEELDFSPSTMQIVQEAIESYLNCEAYSSIVQGDGYTSQKRNGIRGLVETAIGRVLYTRVLSFVKDTLQDPIQRGAVTYSSVYGYLRVLQKMHLSAVKWGVPLRKIVEQLGGRRYGADVKSYSPIFECYERLSLKIPEPARTRLIGHILDLTGRQYQSKRKRRELLSFINEQISDNEEPEMYEKFAAYLLQADFPDIYVAVPLFFAEYSANSCRTIARHLSEVLRTDADIQDVCFPLYSLARAIAEHTEKGGQENITLIMGEKTLQGLLDAYAILYDDFIQEAAQRRLVHTPHQGHKLHQKNGYGVPSEFGTLHLRKVSISDLGFANSVMTGTGISQNRFPLYCSGLTSNLVGLRQPDVVLKAVRFYFPYDETIKQGLGSSKALNIMPDQMYAVLPNGNEIGIVYSPPSSNQAVLLTATTEPFFLDSNLLIGGLRTLSDPGYIEEIITTYWLVNMNRASLQQAAIVHIGNIYDPVFQSGEFADMYRPSLAALLPLYLQEAERRG